MRLLLKLLMALLSMLVIASVSTSAGAKDIYQEKSLYRNILVYDDQGLRCMKFGRHDAGRQTCIALANPNALVLDYTKMLLGALYLKPAPRTILIIGLGGATMPSKLQEILFGAKIDCVELDPSVVKVAKRYFGFSPDKETSIVIEDGRVFVKRAQKQGKKYDLIILDAFDHVYIPEHMLTKEFLIEVRSLLEKDGVLAANTFSSSKLYDAESATYASAFGAFYNLKMNVNNRVILARNDGLPSMDDIKTNAERLDNILRLFGVAKDWLLPLFSTNVQWPAETRILTDQYSPANLLNGTGK
ncbi:MAG: fused MFS/spermidine synthase [Polaromonas sp.]